MQASTVAIDPSSDVDAKSCIFGIRFDVGRSFHDSPTEDLEPSTKMVSRRNLTQDPVGRLPNLTKKHNERNFMEGKLFYYLFCFMVLFKEAAKKDSFF